MFKIILAILAVIIISISALLFINNAVSSYRGLAAEEKKRLVTSFRNVVVALIIGFSVFISFVYLF